MSEEDQFHEDKLNHLIRDNEELPQNSANYSKIVRRVRLVLPIIALGLIAIIFVWSDVQHNNIIPAANPDLIAQTVGKNELVNPKFESTDTNNQPYTITAKRAVQSKADENLVMMDEPTAGMLLNSGEKVGIQSKRGSFRQDTQLLFLRDNVTLTHDKGYTLETQELDLNLKENTAHSETDVHANGPDGTLQSKGLEGIGTEGRIIFGGPAKLVLTKTSKGTGGMFGK